MIGYGSTSSQASSVSTEFTRSWFADFLLLNNDLDGSFRLRDLFEADFVDILDPVNAVELGCCDGTVIVCY